MGNQALVLNRSPLQNFLSYYSIISRWINTRYITRYVVFDHSLARSLLISSTVYLVSFDQFQYPKKICLKIYISQTFILLTISTNLVKALVRARVSCIQLVSRQGQHDSVEQETSEISKPSHLVDTFCRRPLTYHRNQALTF